MKRFALIMVALLLVCASGVAGDIVIPVAFTGAGDITGQCLTGSYGAALNGVDFCYNPFTQADTAQVFAADTVGVFGSTGGTLTMNFAPLLPFPVVSLHFDFLYSPGGLLDIGSPLYVSFNNLDFVTATADTLNAGGGGSSYISGIFNYAGSPFTSADVIFTGATPLGNLASFQIGNLSYDVATPEPGTLGLLGSAMVGLVAFYRRRRT
jgi:hypothetical protein